MRLISLESTETCRSKNIFFWTILVISQMSTSPDQIQVSKLSVDLKNLKGIACMVQLSEKTPKILPAVLHYQTVL